MTRNRKFEMFLVSVHSGTRVSVTQSVTDHHIHKFIVLSVVFDDETDEPPRRHPTHSEPILRMHSTHAALTTGLERPGSHKHETIMGRKSHNAQ